MTPAAAASARTTASAAAPASAPSAQTRAAGGEGHDWNRIAVREPFFGVVSADEFRTDALTDEARARFFASGFAEVADVRAVSARVLGVAPGGRGFDFGCGLGRLTNAMAEHCESVVGYDVAPAMVAAARTHAHSRAVFTTNFPEGPFDWVNSSIVFQHIPPTEGARALAQCLATLAPGGVATIQVTAWRDAALAPATNPVRRALGRWRRAVRAFRARRGAAPVEALIAMHEYDLTEIVRRFVEAGCDEMTLRHTNHGGHHGVLILARRAPHAA